MKIGDRGGSEPQSSFVAYAWVTVVYFFLSLLSYGGSLFAVSKASTVIWGSVKQCPDGLACLTPDQVNTNAVLFAFGWTVLVLLASSAFPGVRLTKFLQGVCVLVALGFAWIAINFLTAILRLQMAWPESLAVSLDTTLIAVAACLTVWFYRRYAVRAAFVGCLTVGVSGLVFFWVSSAHFTTIGFDIEPVAYIGLPALLLATSVAPAAVGLSWMDKPPDLGRVASLFVSSALAWTLIAVTQVVFVMIWVWLGR